jgi:hypothetical protein
MSVVRAAAVQLSPVLYSREGPMSGAGVARKAARDDLPVAW